MKKGTKIALIALGIVLVLGTVIFIGADVFVSRIAMKKVNKALAALPEGEASIGSIQVRLFSGTVGLYDLRFDYRGKPVNKRDTTSKPGISVNIDHIEIGRIFYAVLLNKEVLVSDLRIVEPRVELWLDEKHPEHSFPTIPEDTTLKSFPLNKAELMHLHLQNASFALHSVRTKLDVAVDNCSLKLHDLCYNSAFHFCDSVYRFELEHAAVLTPDGRIHIDARELSQRDQGALTLGTTRIRHTMPKKRLAEMVKEPSTWMDIQVGSLSTSEFNPIRKAIAKDLSLESAEVKVDVMHIYRDTRYKPKRPFPMPQASIMSAKIPFLVKHVSADIRDLDVELASTDINRGELKLNNIHAQAANITNRRGATMKIKGNCPFNEGNAKAHIDLIMNKQCEFALDLHGTGFNFNHLNPFIKPLVGITADCQVDTIDAHYKGDKLQANGTFRMLYHGLQVQVSQDEKIPYKAITHNAKTIQQLGNTLIPKSNPSTVDIRPRAYRVTWKNDEWKPFALFLFGPCIDGVKKTFLPGLYVHEQIMK